MGRDTWLLRYLGAIVIALSLAAPASASERARALSDAVLDQMEAGEFQAVHDGLSPEMQAAVSVQALAQGWTGLQQQFGPLGSRGEPRLVDRGGTTLVVTPLHFQRGTLSANLAFDDQERTISLLLQPAPAAAAAPPAADAGFSEHDFSVGEGDGALPGTLAMPDGEGPFPAVVLVHGSGPQDRDETVGPNKPFLDIARGLAARGIAALRYDKRTLVHRQAAADPDFSVDDETTADAVVAVAALRATPGIDPARVYVFGHSLGAMMAPRIVQRAEGAAGAILLAAPARRLLDLVPDQVAFMSELQGADPSQSQAALDQLTDSIARLRAGEDMAPAQAPLGVAPAYWRSTERVDPVGEARALSQPLLVLHGSRDIQVTDKERQLWEAAFGDDPRVTLKQYPELGHLGTVSDPDDPLAAYGHAGQVDDGLIDDVATWIRKRGRARP